MTATMLAILVTIAVGIAGCVVTWYFSKRRYSRQRRAMTELELEAEKAKLIVWRDVAIPWIGAIVSLIIVGGFFLLLSLVWQGG